MESLKHLVETMNAMVEVHTRLLSLAKEKRDILVKGDISSLQEIIHLESSCVEEIQQLEQTRKQLTIDCLVRKGFSGHSAMLEEIINLETNPVIKTTLKTLGNTLRTTIQEISQWNEMNQQLIQTSLSYIQYSIGLHLQKEPAIGYGPNTNKRYSSLLDAKI